MKTGYELIPSPECLLAYFDDIDKYSISIYLSEKNLSTEDRLMPRQDISMLK